MTDDFASWINADLVPSEPLKAERQFFNLQDSWHKALTQSPAYLSAQIGLENAGITVKINRNGLYPQVNLEAGGGYSGSRAEFSGVLGDIEQREQPSWYVGGVFSYALGNRAARYAHKTSKANYETASLSLKQMEQDIMISVDNAIKNAQASFERVDATRKAREYAEAALAAEQKKLESGKSTSFVVLELQSRLTDARSAEIAALTSYNISLAALASAEGSILERNHIDLEVK
jgi:outer membrane protein TolC